MEIMCPTHAKWNEFINELSSKNGCNLDDENETNFRCQNDYRYSKKILKTMGFSDLEIDESIAYFHLNGLCCDCEVVINIGYDE